MVTLSRLEEIRDLRTVWPHEALDFTPWLAQDENMALLSDAIEIDMTVDEIESCVGDFNVDIFASETSTDRTIIIENQLEDTDHDHLGKLITYASGKSADVIVWLVKRAREEHRAAVEWLNNHTDENIGFFLCEIKLFRIGSSDPAVKFEVVERPNDWTKEVKKATSPDEGQQLEGDIVVGGLLCVAQHAAQQGKDKDADKGGAHACQRAGQACRREQGKAAEDRDKGGAEVADDTHDNGCQHDGQHGPDQHDQPCGNGKRAAVFCVVHALTSPRSSSCFCICLFCWSRRKSNGLNSS